MWESLEGVLFQWWAREGQPRFTQPDGFCCLLFGKIDTDVFFNCDAPPLPLFPPPAPLEPGLQKKKLPKTNEDIQHVWDNCGWILEVSKATKKRVKFSLWGSRKNLSSRSQWGRFWIASGGGGLVGGGVVDVNEDTDAEIWGFHCCELSVKYEKELKGRLLKSMVGVRWRMEMKWVSEL